MFAPNLQLMRSYVNTQIEESYNQLSISNQKKYELLKSIPKFNSHCHLSGEIPLNTLMKYANQDQIQALEKAMHEISFGKDYEKAFSIFPLINQIINTHEKLKEATYQACQRFKEDNNNLVLLRTGLKVLENKDCEEYLLTVLSGIEQACREDFKVFLMLSLKRSSSLEMAKVTVDLALKYRKRGTIGIDISDISTDGNINFILPELVRAKKNGLKIAVHMGESAQEKDQMLIINSLEPDLIDHGVNLCNEAENWVKKENKPVSICLTSSIATKMHDEKEPHLWVKYYLQNNCDHPIDLGTDDSTVFGNIFLTDEFFKLCSNTEFEKVIQIARKSFERAARAFF